ncbi:hypothetical protein L226DRAFT_455370 [Lentinus tigrinus ALCF2SS1-7]|uniref:UbiA prenyltransferase n=1 Tax=Lentinus tigrinus ALCF2SS1-6 TaxID=1328759 RepID=A0A5C2RZX0_9APHY|nr:hypothetical protein L227DRAFT_508296 [Lentinus tigrinus ALCF2SS1-6]RPD79490.1 hypothetical protein L226DRAFT_455370 [Lentinus tigrinus ALCF2SS1-7]
MVHRRDIAVAARNLLGYHVKTAILFTRSDIKTILLPVTTFACAVAPLHSAHRLLLVMLWVWSHQLMCNVSNQANSRNEDLVNKPWRPLPSGRISERQARALRWVVVGACLLFSRSLGRGVVLMTWGLLVTTFLYDEVGLSGHHIGKNLCAIGGYTTIEMGATMLIGEASELDAVAMAAVYLSGAIIFTTVHAQDFADVEGDIALGRNTLPIYAPDLARTFTLVILTTWSLVLSAFWNIGPICRTLFVVLGGLVGARYYLLRNPKADRLSYVFYNIWLTVAHLLPLNARAEILSF